MGLCRRVLVVDDDDTIRELIAAALVDEGYEVGTAVHGKEALDQVTKDALSLILLDIRMPVMDGWEFAEIYRQLPGPHAPIIVLTAGRDAANLAAQIGAAAYLAKPFDLERLLNVVAEHMNGHGPEA